MKDIEINELAGYITEDDVILNSKNLKTDKNNVDYVVPTSTAHMMEDRWWVKDENIIIDRIAKKVAEEPLNRSYLSAPMCLAWREKSKMSFYRIEADQDGKISISPINESLYESE
tara:strand:- start:119 stop:463 length:345 start_codon:yes stop_codon:yes gene_type:complete